MLRVSLLLFVLLQLQTTFADEPAQTKTSSPDEIAKLIDRIDQLENRIKELEQQTAKPSSATIVPQYQPNTNFPRTYQTGTGSPKNYKAPVYPSSPYQPPFPQNKAVPESWRPFNFNGMQYYIIPVVEAARLNRPQENDKTNR